MPRSQRSLNVTAAYRDRLRGIQLRLGSGVRSVWAAIDEADLDGTYNPARVVALIESAQRQSLQASTGYLTAFLSSEMGRRTAGPTPSPEVGVTRAGHPLDVAVQGALIGVKVAIGDGKPPAEALSSGRAVLLRAAGVSTDAVARQAVTDGMAADDRFKGWRRAVRGTCGACLGAATGALASPDEVIDTHPGCQCIQEPVVRGVTEKIRRPSGAQLFAGYAPSHQDEILGPEKAELIRTGQALLSDLIDHSPMKHEDDFLTEAPASALT